MEDVIHSPKRHQNGGLSPLATAEVKTAMWQTPPQRAAIDSESDGDTDHSSESGEAPK